MHDATRLAELWAETGVWPEEEVRAVEQQITAPRQAG
jgi:hypothetical protein